MGKYIYDNPVFQKIEKWVDAFLLNLLWIFVSLPIFTIGASVTALYYTVNKVLIHERNELFHSFWSSFKSNFKQSTVLWLLLLLFCGMTCADTYVLYHLLNNGYVLGNFYILFGILSVLLVILGSYLFPYVARFQDSTKIVIVNCCRIAVANIQWSLLLILLLIVAFLVTCMAPFMIAVVPVIYTISANKILERVFSKYMSEEDFKQEIERNRKYVGD